MRVVSGQLGHGQQSNKLNIDKPKLGTSTCLIGKKKVVHVSCGSFHTAVVTIEGEL